MGGVMSLTGDPDGPPQKVGVPLADVFAGLYGCIGILAALRHRDATGQGQQIDIGMFDTHMAWLANQGMNYLATGENPPRLGNQHPNIVPYQVFATSDGFVVLSIANDPTFKRFCENVGLGHLLDDKRFATNAARVENREAVTEALAPVMKTMTTAAWVERLEEMKVGCGPINTVREAFADPQIKTRGAVVHMPHPATPDGVDVIANPVRLSETPADYRLPPPLLGEHTDDVLSTRLGLDDAKLAALRKNGVI
jgi:crotonobetainyl-CoA:carnitine CoA-transferase CaiB-like acyl-CoA transferase